MPKISVNGKRTAECVECLVKHPTKNHYIRMMIEETILGFDKVQVGGKMKIYPSNLVIERKRVLGICGRKIPQIIDVERNHKLDSNRVIYLEKLVDTVPTIPPFEYKGEFQPFIGIPKAQDEEEVYDEYIGPPPRKRRRYF